MHKINQKQWNKKHKNYKAVINNKPYILTLENNVTVLKPVKIVKEV